MSQRLDDADAVFDARLHAEGKHTHRPKGRTQDYADLMAQLVMEAGMAAEHLATEGGLPIDEYFTDAFLSGVAAAHAEGLGWAEWVLEQREIPAINLGILRAAARRIVAGERRTTADIVQAHGRLHGD